MDPLPENLLLKVASVIHDPVTTTDELIPSGETSSYRSNPKKLAEFTLSRKDPGYVARAKAFQALEFERLRGAGRGRTGGQSLERPFLLLDGRKTHRGRIPSVDPGCRTGKRHRCSQAGRWLRQGAGGLLPEGPRRTGEYRPGICHQKVSEQPDQLGNAALCRREGGHGKLALGDLIYIQGIRQAIQSGKEKVAAFIVRDGRTPLELRLENSPRKTGRSSWRGV